MSDGPDQGSSPLRSRTQPPVELVPERRVSRSLRKAARAAGWLHPVLALAVVLAVFTQVYLIGAYVFGAGQGALDAHRSVGFVVQGLELFVFLSALVAWLPRRDLVLSLLLPVIGTVQITLASAHAWTGGLHPLGAMVVLALATVIARRGLRLQLAGRGIDASNRRESGGLRPRRPPSPARQ